MNAFTSECNQIEFSIVKFESEINNGIAQTAKLFVISVEVALPQNKKKKE